MGSTQGTQNTLEQRLAALEAFGLRRPSYVLLSEYLDALIAERVLDEAAAAPISDAYNRARYAVDSAADPGVADAAAALEQVALALAAMTAEDRQRLVARIRERIELPESEQPQALVGNGESVSPTSPVPLPRQNGVDRERGLLAASAPEQRRLADRFPAPAGFIAFVRAILRRRRLELSAVVGLALFFAGYFYRDLANMTIDPRNRLGRQQQTKAIAQRANPADLWMFPKQLVEVVARRGLEDERARQWGKARIAYQMVLGYSPNDPTALNNMAWVLLFPDETGTTDPKRALQLVSRAIQKDRSPNILDTAAEANFQCGNVHEAVRLEREAVIGTYNNADVIGSDVRNLFERRLAKYWEREQQQRAGDSTTSSSLPGNPAIADAPAVNP
jgi:tetratricopeptide (TPR) repeat protein